MGESKHDLPAATVTGWRLNLFFTSLETGVASSGTQCYVQKGPKRHISW